MSYMFNDVKPISAKKQRRKEKSREAARCRRTKESEMFQNITNMLPVAHDLVSHLDRSSVMRLVNSFIKLRQNLNPETLDPNSIPFQDLAVKQEVTEDKFQLSSDDFVNALNGFLFILSADFDILFVSENVKGYLGLSKLDLVGQSVLTFVHEGDHEEIRECFSDSNDSIPRRSFFLRMKSTLTVNGKSINLKSASYKVLQCSGFRPNHRAEGSNLFVIKAEPIPHPSNIEHFMDSKTFLTQHTPDMKFSYCDESITELLGYREADMLGKSFYEYCHVQDIKAIDDIFQKLYRINQVETGQYRFLSKSGGYHWVVTQATVIPCPKNQKPQCIVCVHSVLSAPVLANTVFALEQQQQQQPAAEPLFDVIPLEQVISDEEEKAEIEEAYKETGLGLLNASNASQLSASEPPPVQDQCRVVQLQFTDMDENDDLFNDDIFNNAPCIGDPWMISTPEKAPCIDDLFRDVVVESNPTQSAGCEPPAALENPPSDIRPSMSIVSPQPLHKHIPTKDFAFQPRNARPQSNQQQQSLQHHQQQQPDVFRSSSSSPCDSAYCGSPLNFLPGCFDENQSSSAVAGPRSLARDIGRFQGFQRVTVPEDAYNEHVSNLRRGYISNGMPPDENHKSCPRKRNLAASAQDLLRPSSPTSMPPPVQKRRCYDRPSHVMFGNHNVAQAACREQRPFQKIVNVLLQPGNGYGCTQEKQPHADGDLLRSLLQPELSQANGTWKQSAASSNLLPEISIYDCEVNAPLPLGNGNLPLGPDCVHALDQAV